MPRGFAAYRADWTAQRDFFLAHGFRPAREIVNFIMELVDMPTPSARAAAAIEPLTPADVPAVLALAPKAFRVRDAVGLEQHLLHNSYFPPDSVRFCGAAAAGRRSAYASWWRTRPTPTRTRSTPPCPASASAPSARRA